MSSPQKLITPESFSEAVMVRAMDKKETLLESMAHVVEELDIDEASIKKMVTAPLYSRLEAECNDSRLLKDKPRSKKLI
ncbi:putative later promoter transcription factor [Serratia phage vB_SmaA_3M]|uniref:Putative later promoter transcription factor n=1 Tax=Serratia phage vB_SmaA_3M TaxID=2419930 RepID=A0A3G2YSA8_9CAUD|nr:putative later promoter transcription factor [Serratia phage vB_SmaA_3M]AYP28403.1 putative later promoter transcription factor [Serratia phage vB_SmaA_3M]